MPPVDGPEAFTTDLLDRFAETLQSEFAAYFEFDAESPAAHPLDHRHATLGSKRYVHPPWPHRPPEVPPWLLVHGDVSFWSDDFQRAMRWRFETAPWTRTCEVVDSRLGDASGRAARNEASLLSSARGTTSASATARPSSALGPHLTALIRNARARRRLVDLAALADPADDDDYLEATSSSAATSRSSTPRPWRAESSPPGSTAWLVASRRCSRNGCSQTSAANRSASSATARGSCSKHRHRRHSSLPRNESFRQRSQRANERSWAGLPPESRRTRLPRALDHACDRQQAPSPHLPEARSHEPHRCARSGIGQEDREAPRVNGSIGG